MSTRQVSDSEFDDIVDEAARAWLRENNEAGPGWLHEDDVDEGSHPGIEALVSFQEGKLSERRSSEVAEHLADCERCRDEMQSLEGFDAATPESGPGDEVASHRGWLSFVRRREQSSSTRSTLGSQQAVLAVSLLAVLGLGTLMWSLGSETIEGHPLVVDLLPDDTALERGTSGRDIRLPRDVDFFVPRLNFGDQTPYEAYDLEVTDAEGGQVFYQRSTVRDPQGRIALLIPRKRLQTGQYRITLTGLEEGAAKTLAVYSFRLTEVS